MRRRAVWAMALCLAAGCRRPDTDPVSAAVRARPYVLREPGSPGPSPRPLVLMFHGYGDNGSHQWARAEFSHAAAARGLLLATPDGTPDHEGRRFWNAGPACCNFDGAPVDDVGYVRALVQDAVRSHGADPTRVYLVGHSNGGFLAYRLACEGVPGLRGIAVVGAALPDTPDRCTPGTSVPVLHLHGENDDVVRVAGGLVLGRTPHASVLDSLAPFLRKDRCGVLAWGNTADPNTARRIPGGLRVLVAPDCADGAVEFWTLLGEGHVPAWSRAAAGAVLDWLLGAHPPRDAHG